MRLHLAIIMLLVAATAAVGCTHKVDHIHSFEAKILSVNSNKTAILRGSGGSTVMARMIGTGQVGDTCTVFMNYGCMNAFWRHSCSNPVVVNISAKCK